MLVEAVFAVVGTIAEISDLVSSDEVVSDGVNSIGVEKENKMEDETETVEVATTELSDIATRDEDGEMNEEVDAIKVDED